MDQQQKSNFFPPLKRIIDNAAAVTPDVARVEIVINLIGPDVARTAEVKLLRANNAGWEGFGFLAKDVEGARGTE